MITTAVTLAATSGGCDAGDDTGRSSARDAATAAVPTAPTPARRLAVAPMQVGDDEMSDALPFARRYKINACPSQTLSSVRREAVEAAPARAAQRVSMSHSRRFCFRVAENRLGRVAVAFALGASVASGRLSAAALAGSGGAESLYASGSEVAAPRDEALVILPAPVPVARSSP